MIWELMIILMIYLIYVITFNVVYTTNPDSEEIVPHTPVVEDGFVSLQVSNNCTDPNTTYMTACQPHGVTSVCRRDSRYTEGDFTCDSSKSCASGFGHRSVCQQVDAGACMEKIAPNLSPLSSESANVKTKTCDYETADVCSTLDDYSFIYNFTDTVQGGKIEKGSMNKCTRHFCSLPAEGECPIDPLTGAPHSKCSRFVVDGIEGSYCNVWLNTKSAEEQNALFVEYCENNPDSGDCACIARREDAEFIAKAPIADFKDIADECWWKSCKNPDSYLVPPAMRSTECRDIVCGELENSLKVDCNDINCPTGKYLDVEGCVDCTVCDPSIHDVTQPCSDNKDRVCVDKPTSCPEGTFSSDGDFSKCVKCTKCDEGQYAATECSQTKNTVCENVVNIYGDAMDAIILLLIGVCSVLIIVGIGYILLHQPMTFDQYAIAVSGSKFA